MTAPPSPGRLPEAQLLAKFVAAFKRGIEREVAAMQASSAAFEIALARGEDLGALRYGFELTEASERLAAGVECSLRTAHGLARVTLERCDEQRVMVVAEQPIDVAAAPFALVIAPWFLYDRLTQTLDGLAVDSHAVGVALTLFGKQPPRRAAAELRGDHGALNASQRAAVQLCVDSELAFVWGPPGTGKTVTLTHVIEELLARGQRILLASTTNAAIDQVLAKVAGRPGLAAAIDAGAVIRLGRSEADTFGAELADAVRRAEGTRRRSVDQLRARIAEVELHARNAERLIAELAPAIVAQQSLFAEPATGLRATALASVFSPGLADAIAALPARAQGTVLQRRLARLVRVRTLARARVSAHLAELRGIEERVVGQARMVMCTLTNAYLSPLMKAQRFDVLIAEEAGMATLPVLFAAACLCRAQAIMVGDPRQLPPIVQSREELVRRAIGRSVFDVTIPDPATSDVVAMLETQYRMHPVIGALVGRLFYDGRLAHGTAAGEVDAIAARAPYRGMPLVVVDTAGRTACDRAARGSSRVNPASAEITAGLAFDAVADGATSVAVITPYAAQARDIRQRLVARRIGDAVECSTIHRFQGRECDVVIIDLVDAAPMRLGILLSGTGLSADVAHLLNVSISRARGKLVIVADVAYFEAQAPGGIATAILRAARRDGACVPLAPP